MLYDFINSGSQVRTRDAPGMPGASNVQDNDVCICVFFFQISLTVGHDRRIVQQQTFANYGTT